MIQHPGARLSAALTAGVCALATSTAGAAATPRVDPAGANAPAAARLPGGYTFTLVAPSLLPDGSGNGLASHPVGIADSGWVAGNVEPESGDPLPFVGNGRDGQWLDASADGSASQFRATAIGPAGRVVGGPPSPSPFFYVWGVGTSLRERVEVPGANYQVRVGAVNDSAVYAGAADSVKSSAPFYGANGRVVSVPTSLTATYDITGISQAGRAVGIAHRPSQPSTGTFPRGVVLTASGVTPVRAPRSSAVDGISPNGRYLVGRVGVPETPGGSRGTAAWLSTSANPVTLKGATNLRPRGVNDAGVVVGQRGARAVAWQSGRMVDLTRRTVNLPAGWTLTDAVAVNARGQIAVRADTGGPEMAGRLTPSR